MVKVAEHKVDRINRLLGLNWQSPVKYTKANQLYTALTFDNPGKKNSCDSLIDPYQMGAFRFCPYYIHGERYCMRHDFFILDPSHSSCPSHPKNQLEKIYRIKSEIARMEYEFEQRQEKSDECDDFLSDLLNDIESLNVVPVTETIEEVKRDVLKMALRVFAKISQYKKGGLVA